jgi:predicted regulator of Ras-like GTPase activity (Roadblock/LC7/MglB family)
MTAPPVATPVAPPAAPPAAPGASFVPAFPSAAGKSGADTNYFMRNEVVEEPEEKPVFLKKDGTPGTAFLKRYATPNEIVNKASLLSGVDGALIALPDGLLVACKISPSMNADTIAAFLPQIFTKVSQCTRELRLGDLNNLNFTVGNIPWKIFKVGAIYFAAFGRAGEAMPTAQLARLAAELDHKAK